jgi:F0F1-type ATP synthase membrane subunit c/vacuolar-type H+-ATPase subunit K
MSLGLDEEKAKAKEAERAVDANYRNLRIIWLAILASLVAVLVVSRLVQPEQSDADKTRFWILLMLGIANFGASFVLKQKLLKQAREQRKPATVKSAYIVAFALCDSIGVLGLVVHFATGFEYYYFFFVLAGFGLLLHKPQRDDLLAASAGSGLWEARKND